MLEELGDAERAAEDLAMVTAAQPLFCAPYLEAAQAQLQAVTAGDAEGCGAVLATCEMVMKILAHGRGDVLLGQRAQLTALMEQAGRMGAGPRRE